MSLDDPNIPLPPDEPVNDGSTEGTPPPPPPPPAPPLPVWTDSTPDEPVQTGWRVGSYTRYDEGDEKPKRKARPDGDYGEGQTFEWHEAWIAAVTQPGVATYEALIHDPRASLRRGALWLAALMLIGSLVQFGIISMFGLGIGSFEATMGSTVLFLICAPVSVVVGFILLGIGWGAQHLAARLLGGKGTFEQLFYANSCYYAPLMVASLISFVPCLGTLAALVLGIYQLVLNVIAVRAVHGLDWGRAVVACFWLILVLCGCIVCAAVMLVPSGAAVQNFIESLYTPTP